MHFVRLSASCIWPLIRIFLNVLLLCREFTVCSAAFMVMHWTMKIAWYNGHVNAGTAGTMVLINQSYLFYPSCIKNEISLYYSICILVICNLLPSMGRALSFRIFPLKVHRILATEWRVRKIWKISREKAH